MNVLIHLAKRLLGLLVLPWLNFGCTSQTETFLFSADCNDHTLSLVLIAKKTFETVYYSHKLVYNNRIVDVIDYEQLGSTIPYRPTVYGKAPWHLLDTTTSFFKRAGYDTSYKKIPVMLFIDKAEWTPQEFGQLYSCLRQHHRVMQERMEGLQPFQPYQFGGMVYGREDEFMERYEKTKNDYFSIYPDGRISHTLTENFGLTITSSNGLSNNVLMPGNRILLDTAQLSMAELRTYRNTRTNRLLTGDFDIRIDTVFHSR